MQLIIHILITTDIHFNANHRNAWTAIGIVSRAWTSLRELCIWWCLLRMITLFFGVSSSSTVVIRLICHRRDGPHAVRRGNRTQRENSVALTAPRNGEKRSLAVSHRVGARRGRAGNIFFLPFFLLLFAPVASASRVHSRFSVFSILPRAFRSKTSLASVLSLHTHNRN